MIKKETGLLSRLDYSVFILELPVLGKKETRMAASNRLRVLYPGSFDSVAFSLAANGSKTSWLAFIYDKKNAALALPVSTLLIKTRTCRNADTIIWIASDCVEVISVHKGALQKTIVRCRGNESLEDVIPVSTEAESSVYICAREEDRDKMRELVRELPVPGKVYVIDEVVKSSRYHEISINPEFSPAIKLRNYALLAFIVVIMIAGNAAFMKFNEIALRHRQETARVEQDVENRRAQDLVLQSEYESLHAHYISLLAGHTYKPHEVMAVIDRSLKGTVLLQQITIEGNEFSIDVVSQGYEALIAGIQGDEFVKDACIDQVVTAGSKQNVTLSGELRIPSFTENTNASIEQRIELVRKLIEQESRDTVLREEKLSVFVECINETVKNERVMLDSLRTVQSGEYADVSINITGTASGVLSTVRAFGLKNNLMQIDSVVIRNFPQSHKVTASISLVGKIGVDDTAVQLSEYGNMPSGNASVTGFARRFGEVRTEVRAEVPKSESIQTANVTRPSAERVSWLEFVGEAVTGGNTLIYLKDNRTGELMAFSEDTSSGAWYVLAPGGFEVCYGTKKYQVER